jgi:hypothetical protein
LHDPLFMLEILTNLGWVGLAIRNSFLDGFERQAEVSGDFPGCASPPH